MDLRAGTDGFFALLGPRNMSIAHMAYSTDNKVVFGYTIRLGADINLGFGDYSVWNLFNMACEKEYIAFSVRLFKMGAEPDFNNLPPSLRDYINTASKASLYTVPGSVSPGARPRT